MRCKHCKKIIKKISTTPVYIHENNVYMCFVFNKVTGFDMNIAEPDNTDIRNKKLNNILL